MPSIRFDKISVFDRPAEPVSLGIPFGRGELADPGQFRVHDRNREFPAQVRATSTWDDGSVRWLMAHFQPDLPGNRSHRLEYGVDGSDTIRSSVVVEVHETDDMLEVDNGVLKLGISRTDGSIAERVELEGTTTYEGSFSGFRITTESGQTYSTEGQTIDLIEVVDAGPLRAEIEAIGTHCSNEGTSLFDYSIKYVVWAGKPWVELEYQFVNRERSGEVILTGSGFTFRPGSEATDTRLGEGYYRTEIKEGPSEFLLDQETILYQSVEHVLETFYGDFWADWANSNGGVAITQFQAHQNFPKRLKVDKKGIDVDVYPIGQPPISILQGVAKTHRFLLHFHVAATSVEEITARSLQFQMPDIAILPESVYREAGVWENLFPERLSSPIEVGLIDLADNRARGLGMIHWGDGPDAGYTQQGRGRGDLVWTNNEYDFPHAMYLMFAKTGERRFRDIATVAAQHWIDVDFCHYSDDPLKVGGQPIHTANHVTGGVTPSHEWTEGLLDFYHFTGKREALTKAVSIADNMIRHLESPRFSQAGGFAARETGWAMRGLIGVYQETREQKYLDACDGIARQFMSWKQEWGAFLAPYTSHTQVRVPFMISIAVNALARYHAVTADDCVKSLIVDEMRDLLEHCVMPDGRFFYKELPSLNRRAGGPREMEALSHAYLMSGDETFLDQTERMMKALVRRGIGGGGGGSKTVAGDHGIVFGGASPKAFGSTYVPLMIAYKTLSDAGRLDDLV
ncbi:MAG TPA: hypothetical protein DHW45_11370 [Candidatus Latescibacteria bacterium]|nr:hypothetical protein [Candidatus Latescibacterota bacterium]